jgi:hypothetical protein
MNTKEKAEMNKTDAGTQGLRDSGTTSKAMQKVESRNLKPTLNPQPSTLNLGETTDHVKGKAESRKQKSKTASQPSTINYQLRRDPRPQDFGLWSSTLAMAVGLLAAGSAWGAASTNATPVTPASSATAAAFTNLMAGTLGGTKAGSDVAATMDTLDD